VPRFFRCSTSLGASLESVCGSICERLCKPKGSIQLSKQMDSRYDSDSISSCYAQGRTIGVDDLDSRWTLEVLLAIYSRNGSGKEFYIVERVKWGRVRINGLVHTENPAPQAKPGSTYRSISKSRQRTFPTVTALMRQHR
jgi:hypothetical protein